MISGRSNDTTYRLFTTILDPEDASAVELAGAYAQRWEIETAFDELKTHQRGPKEVVPGVVEVDGWWSLSGRCRSGIVQRATNNSEERGTT